MIMNDIAGRFFGIFFQSARCKGVLCEWTENSSLSVREVGKMYDSWNNIPYKYAMFQSTSSSLFFGCVHATLLTARCPSVARSVGQSIYLFTVCLGLSKN